MAALGPGLSGTAPAPPAARLLDGWAPAARRLGVYVHVPFCARRCGYCSFNTAPYVAETVPRYLRALGREIELVRQAPWAPDVTLATVFLGGGTPSVLTPIELGGVLERLRNSFAVAPDAEITVECNPESVTRDRLAGYRAAGVNRVSLGVQSLDDGLLRALERSHTATGARAAFAAARAAGFADVSVDLIYGLPGLDLATWERTVATLLAWEPDHLSAYALTLEEGSGWHARGVSGLPLEEAVTAQYWLLAERAPAAGLAHYEISNYARPQHRSAHNQIYWRAAEYLGLGPGACGFLGRVRYANARATDRYCAALEQEEIPVASHETLTDRQRLAERLVLGLRLAEGVPEAWLSARVALEDGGLSARLAAWEERGLLLREAGRARLTEAGFLLSDSLFVDLL